MKFNRILPLGSMLCALQAVLTVNLYAQSARLSKYDIFPDVIQNIEDHAAYTVVPDSSPKPALSFITGLPVLAYATCSGAPVASSLWSGPMFLSAEHCFPPGVVNSPWPRGAYASGNILGVVNPGAAVLKFLPGQGQLDPVQDFALFPVKGAVSGAAHIYRLAKGMPAIGERLTFWGYPVLGLPLFGGVAPLARMDCSYLGPFLASTVNVRHKPFTLIHAAQCPRKYFVKGMSGGPVLNSAGEIVGTLSMSTFSPEFQGEGTVLLFPEITEARLNPLSSPGNRDFIRPIADGTRLYSPVYMLTQLPSTQNPLDNIGNAFPVYEPATFATARGNFEVPVKGQLVSGVLRSYADSGAPIDCARYQNGKFIESVPCD